VDVQPLKRILPVTLNTLKQFVSTGSLLAFVFTCLTLAGAQTFTGVITQHNDNGRTGQNLLETTLTPSNVTPTTFGKLFSYSVDGQMYAQPLYVPNVNIGGTTHNVVYVVTQNDSLYAFDADGLQSTALWQVSFVNPSEGITPLTCFVYCGVYPVIGITATPVIDLSTNTMYLVSRIDKKGKFYQTLHALDITSGAEKFGGPVTISASIPGTGDASENGIITFNSHDDLQRAGLLELNGTIYIGWAGAYHGWMMAYNATTLQQEAVFSATPNAKLGGVWATGNGVAADSNGNIYAAIGDALFDANTGGSDYGDSLLQFNSSLQVQQYFTPNDEACRQANDLDLGSAGPIVLPGLDEILIAGKGGAPCDSDPVASRMYLVSTTNLGGYNATQNPDLEEVIGSTQGYWSSPAYFNGPSGAYIYSAGINGVGKGDYLKAYSVGSNGLLSSTAVAQSPETFPSGGTPSISANGTSNGIVWVTERPEGIGVQPGAGAAILRAYNAIPATGSSTLTELYNSSEALVGGVARDRGGCANKYTLPTIANGMVYVGTQNELDVFGLLGSSTGPGFYLSNPCWTFAASAIGTAVSQPIAVINNGTGTLSISNITITGHNAADFSQTNTCTTPLATGKKCVITVSFTASVSNPEWVNVMITDNAVGSPHNIFVLGVGKSASATATKAASGKTELGIGTQVRSLGK
jgi:hypothetical protein